MTRPEDRSRSESVGRSSALMAAGTLLSRITGAIRTIALAAFGLGALTDAYGQANTTPNLIFELVAGGVLSATLIPLFSQLLRRGTDRAREGIDAIVSLVAIILVAASVLLAIGAPLVLRLTIGTASKNAQKLHVASQLLPLFAPQVLIYGFIALIGALLNVRKRFLAPMLTPVLNNLVVIAVLLWVNRLLHRPGTALDNLAEIASNSTTRLLLGLGTTVGVFAQALALIPSMRASGIRLRWHWEPRHPAIREMLRVSLWTFAYVASNQVSLLLVQYLANRGANGDFSAYTFSFQMYFLLPHGLFAVSIATAIQPRLAAAFLERRRGRFRAILNRAMVMQLTIMVPAAVGYLVLAPSITRILRFGRMTLRSADLLAATLQCFAIGLPAFSMFLLLMNACKAMRDTRLAFRINAIETALNIVLALTFTALGWGVRGLALAYGFAYVLGSAIAFVAVGRRTNGLDGRALLDALTRVLAASLIMGAAAWLAQVGVHRGFGPDQPLGFGLSVRFTAIAEVGVAMLAGVTVYVSVGRLLGVRELQTVATGIARRFGPTGVGQTRLNQSSTSENNPPASG